MTRKDSSIDCPCGSGKALAVCCAACIDGSAPASSAEALMRSRYTAYSQRNERYLFDTWHPSTRPERIELEAGIQWLRLKILNTGPDHVEFTATYKIQGKAHTLQENSRFVYQDQKWFYLDGIPAAGEASDGLE